MANIRRRCKQHPVDTGQGWCYTFNDEWNAPFSLVHTHNYTRTPNNYLAQMSIELKLENSSVVQYNITEI
jgi:hypothetical protein